MTVNSLAKVGVDFRFVRADWRRLQFSLLVLLVVVFIIRIYVDFSKRRTRSILGHFAENYTKLAVISSAGCGLL